MRKTITILLAAAALAGLAAQPAAADDTYTIQTTKDSWGWNTTQECFTPWREGVVGQYGAWGAYHDGCTVLLRCHYNQCSFNRGEGSLTRQRVYGQEHYYYYEQTCNVRLRVYDRYGRLKWYRDGTGRSKGSDSGGGWVCTATAWGHPRQLWHGSLLQYA